MGEETGRKSQLRRARAIVVLAVILAISLTPAIFLRFFPSEASALMLAPVWNVIESRTGFPKESAAGVWIMISFVLTILTASALLLVLAHGVTGSVRKGS